MKIVWTQAALAHLTDIYAYISRDSPRYAERMVDRITSRSNQLAAFPESGQIVAEYEHPEIRQIIEGAYRIIYRTTADRLEILSVLHGARRLPVDPPQV